MNTCTSFVARHCAKCFHFFSLLGYLVCKRPWPYSTDKELQGHWPWTPGSLSGRAQASDPALSSSTLTLSLNVNFCPAQFPWLFLEPWRSRSHVQYTQAGLALPRTHVCVMCFSTEMSTLGPQSCKLGDLMLENLLIFSNCSGMWDSLKALVESDTSPVMEWCV